MGILSLFRRGPKQDIQSMNKMERKDFLANDLIERMIRIEQKVTGSMGGGFVPYFKTDYFKNLPDSEKIRYKKYIEKKERTKKWRLLPWVIIIGGGFFLSSKITGNVIGTEPGFSTTNMILIGIFILILLIYLEQVISKRNRWKRLERHFHVMEKIVSKRRISR